MTIDDQQTIDGGGGYQSPTSSSGLARECVASSPDSTNGGGVVLPPASGSVGEKATPPPVRSDEHVPPVRGSKKRKPSKSDGFSLRRLLTGLGSKAVYLEMVQPPTTYAAPLRAIRKFREHIARETIERHGNVSSTKAAIISTACINEQGYRIVATCLRRNNDKLDDEQRLKMLDAMSKFAERRDAALAKLDLDADIRKRAGAIDVTFQPVAPAAIPTHSATSPIPEGADE